ncbi:GTP cyclohydrolase II [Geothrix sp. 21YS21S-2]|uniref:GTP cyclohydrolase II n=1 Tax=Geothrix sp. 21YS21S-2 TaxID=3068893 RepID=UPI0027BA9CBD|nr:GTP cyclohydrolase II [Geothrix sp. 21YS21S-2]
MAPKDSSSAPHLELGPESPLEVVTRFETESVPFVAKANVPSIFGKYVVYGFLEKMTGKEHLAIVSGDIDARKRVNVRIHSECWTGDVLGSLKCDCRAQLESALRYVGEHGGIVLYLRQEGRGIGLLNKLKAYALQEQGFDTVEANHELGFADDLRTYESAVEMLKFFGIRKVRLLTNNPRKIDALEGAGIHVQREAHQLASNPYNLKYLKTKANKSGHMLDFKEDPKL